MSISDLGRFSDPAILILTSLADGPKHGYAMMEDIERIAGIRLGPGTLYGALARLEERGWIKPMPSQERRHPYILTESGADLLREQLASLESLVSIGLQRLGGAVA